MENLQCQERRRVLTAAVTFADAGRAEGAAGPCGTAAQYVKANIAMQVGTSQPKRRCQEPWFILESAAVVVIDCENGDLVSIASAGAFSMIFLIQTP